MPEPRNVQAVRVWFAIHRPDVKKAIVDSLIGDNGSFWLMAAGFEAGRHFQAEYPHLDPMNVKVYNSAEPIPDAPMPEPTPLEAVPPISIPVALEENVDAEAAQIKAKSVWIHRRTQDTCNVKKVDNGNVLVADSFGDTRSIPVYMFLQSFNPKGG